MFKAGDKVLCIRNQGWEHVLPLNTVFEVDRVSEDSHTHGYIIINFPMKYSVAFDPSRFILAEPQLFHQQLEKLIK